MVVLTRVNRIGDVEPTVAMATIGVWCAYWQPSGNYNSLTSSSYTLALPLTVLHMPYTSYLDTTQHHGAAGSPHVARDVRLYLIRLWGSVSKTRKKEILTFIVYKNKKT
jgi:hypothetical protein